MWGKHLIKLSIIPISAALLSACATGKAEQSCAQTYSFSTYITAKTGDLEKCKQLCESMEGCTATAEGSGAQIDYNKVENSCDSNVQAEAASARDLLAENCQTSSSIK